MSLQYAFDERTSLKAKKPRRYQVIMLNDDFTPMDFVVEILRTIFHKEETEAISLMFAVHKGGKAVVGVYSYDIAMTKVTLAEKTAREEGYPFRLKMLEV